MIRCVALLAVAAALGGCTVTAVSEVASFGGPQPVWAIDAQASACASSRAAGVVVGDPGALAGVPFVGSMAQAGAESLEAEATCRIVRTLGPDERARLRTLQIAAARDLRTVEQGAFAASARPTGDGCRLVATRHLPSGRALAPQRLCPDGRGGLVPLV